MYVYIERERERRLAEMEFKIERGGTLRKRGKQRQEGREGKREIK